MLAGRRTRGGGVRIGCCCYCRTAMVVRELLRSCGVRTLLQRRWSRFHGGRWWRRRCCRLVVAGEEMATAAAMVMEGDGG